MYVPKYALSGSRYEINVIFLGENPKVGGNTRIP
jgi:hypothetical protein